DRRRHVLRPRMRDLAGRHLDAHGDGEGQERIRGRGDAEGGAARGDRDSAHPGATQMRDPRPDDAEARPAQGEGHAAPRRSGRARRAGTEVVPELDVCPADELGPGEMKLVVSGLTSVGVYNLDG